MSENKKKHDQKEIPLKLDVESVYDGKLADDSDGNKNNNRLYKFKTQLSGNYKKVEKLVKTLEDFLNKDK